MPAGVRFFGRGLDYKIMGRFFSGLAQAPRTTLPATPLPGDAPRRVGQAGAWACFDEFNRIQAPRGLRIPFLREKPSCTRLKLVQCKKKSRRQLRIGETVVDVWTL